MSTTTKQLFNKYNAPVKKKVPHGNPLYEYKYKDKKTGEIKVEKRNMQEKIQSYLSQVDYKKRIELGLGLEAPIENAGNFTADFTGLPDNTIDIVNLTNALASLSPEQVAYILQQNVAGGQTTNQSGQTTSENTEANTVDTPSGVSSPAAPPDTGTTGGL